MTTPVRTALITGGTKNTGRAIALELAGRGMQVVVNGRADQGRLDETIGAVHAQGGEAIGVLGDVADPRTGHDLAAAARDRFGPVDVLVHVPAVRPHQPFLSISASDWSGVLATNLDALFHVCQAVLPEMKSCGWGRIIGFSGAKAFSGQQIGAHVTASKAGVVHLIRSLAFEFAEHGITANTLVPGPVNTERDQAYQLGDHTSFPVAAPSSGAALPPIARRASPQEIASACAHLVSEDAAYITGQSIHVNGGKHFY